MILESVENGPLIWPSIEENRVTRPKKYSELSATEAIQADCDIKATNIILLGLPQEVYALERITKKRTKNEAKTTKPDSEWKSRKKTKSKSKPKPEKVNRKSTQVNPEAKSQEKQV
ncbi:hypothetical protein Tco_0431122 [Tanacetum coccineum]